MEQELIEDLDSSLSMLQELSKRHKAFREQNIQLNSLVAAMESDQKKASRLLNDFEKMQKDRERMREKITELLDRLERLRI
ncbi:MAG: hypothetical protein HYT79_05675 [Elusimicrobia bacterium]|nr:hypothetical protein [Elusimicrobiota bacterium]